MVRDRRHTRPATIRPATPARAVVALALALALLLAGAADAPAKKVRYMVTAVGVTEEHRTSESLVAAWFAEVETRTTYVVRSPKPFVFSRDDLTSTPFFRFATPVAGRVTQTGSGHAWAVIGPPAPTVCAGTISGSGGGRVAGEVSLSGLNPARAVVDVGVPESLEASRTSVGGCTPGGPFTWTHSAQIEDAKVYTRRADLRKAFGKPFTLTNRDVYDELPGQRTTTTWTLRFTPVAEKPRREQWRVEITGRDMWSWGRTSTIGAGVWVNWTHRTDLEVVDGKVRNARARVLVSGVEPFSTPPDLFSVTSRKTLEPSYDVRIVRKRGRRVELRLLDDRLTTAPRNSYRVDYGVRLNPGEQSLDVFRAAGFPIPTITYQTLLDRGTIDVYERGHVPNSFRVVFSLRPGVHRREPASFAEQLPCNVNDAQGDCFLTRGGEEIRITRIR
jgi:hypothetical protein